MLRFAMMAILVAAAILSSLAQVNGALLFQSGRHLYTVNPDGSGLTQVTRQPLDCLETALVWPRPRPGSDDVLLTGRDGLATPFSIRSAQPISFGQSGVYVWYSADGRYLRRFFQQGGEYIFYENDLNMPSGTGWTKRPLPALKGVALKGRFAATPDGKALIFAVNEEEAFHEKYALTSISLEDGARKPFGTGTLPTFSPDGTRMAYLLGGSLWVAKADNSDVRAIALAANTSVGMLAFSPDGTRLIFTATKWSSVHHGPFLYTISTDGTDLRQVPLGYEMTPVCPVWLPRVVPGLPTPFLDTPADLAGAVSQPVRLAWQPVPGAKSYTVQVSLLPGFPRAGRLECRGVTAAELTLRDLQENAAHYWRVKAEGTEGAESYWSPTRSFATDLIAAPLPAGKVVFVSTRGGTPDVYVMNLDGTGLRQLTHDAVVKCPRFTPDGTQVAFIADRGLSTNDTVEMIRLDGTGRRTVGKEEHINGIAFSTDDRYLYYEWNGRDYGDTFGRDRIDLQADGKIEGLYEGFIDHMPPLSDVVGQGPRSISADSGNFWIGKPEADDARLLPMLPMLPSGVKVYFGPGGRFIVCPVLVTRDNGEADLDIRLLATEGTLTRTLAPSAAQEAGVDLWLP